MARNAKTKTHLENLQITPVSAHGDTAGDTVLEVIALDADRLGTPTTRFAVSEAGCVTSFENIVVDTSGAVTIAATDNNKTYIASKSASTTFTLPAPATALKGMKVTFIQSVAQDMVIDGTADKMIVFGGDGTSKTATFGTTSEKLGAAAVAICTGTMWVVIGLGKATITVA